MTILRIILKPVFFFLFWPRIIGDEVLRKYRKSAIIVASNHIFEFDIASMGAPMRRNLHFLSKIELSRPPQGWFFRWFGLVYVDRDRPSGSIDHAAEFLKSDRAIGIFPEGTTQFKQSNELLPFKFGAVKMAAKTGAPIIPIAISGRYKLFGIPAKERLTIRFGRPIFVKPNANIEQANENLRSAIAELLKKDCVKVVKIAGRPAKNPSKNPPITDEKDEKPAAKSYKNLKVKSVIKSREKSPKSAAKLSKTSLTNQRKSAKNLKRKESKNV